MGMIVNQEGIKFLAKSVLSLAEQFGLQNALKIVETQPDLFIELLEENHIQSKGNSKSNLISSVRWTAENAEHYIKNLKLTNCQSLILKTIINNNNCATLDELQESLKKSGMVVNTGSMIGGSLAGITKKCESYNIPTIYTTDHSNDQIRYQIVPEAKDLIPKFLN